MRHKIRLVTLTASHNRKEKTVKALSDIAKGCLGGTFESEHYLVDAGSTDGTVEHIRKNMPEVRVVSRDQTYFWAQAMRAGWEEIRRRETFDALLVYNDDIELDHDSVERVVSTWQLWVAKGFVQATFIGSMRSARADEVTYGGIRYVNKILMQSRRLAPLQTGELLIDSFNMNFTLIPATVLLAHGFLDKSFRHGYADYDYGLRLGKRGVINILCKGYFGFCERNKNYQEDFVNRGLVERLSVALAVKNHPAKERAVFARRHGGWLWFPYFLGPYIRALFGKGKK